MRDIRLGFNQLLFKIRVLSWFRFNITQGVNVNFIVFNPEVADKLI